MTDNDAGQSQNSEKGKANEPTSQETSDSPLADLPTDVRVKLRRLDKLEGRYQGESSRPSVLVWFVSSFVKLIVPIRFVL